MIQCFLACFRRELALNYARLSDLLTVLVFFAMIAALFPFGLGSDRALLQAVGPGVIWIVALLSLLSAMNRIIRQDHDDGNLDQLRLLDMPFVLVLLAKWLAHWVALVVPLILLAPLLGLLYALDNQNLWLILLTLLLGTPALSALGLAGAVLSVEARLGHVILPLLVLPLSIPVVIFALGIISAHNLGLPTHSIWLQLTALPFLYLPISLLAANYGLTEG